MIKRIIIPIVIFLSFLSIYFGAYKPLVKAKMFISFQGRIPTFRTLDDLTASFDSVFNFYSPIGQEEIVKFANSQFENMVLNKNQSELAAVSLTKYAEQNIIKGNVVHLLQVGNMYEILYDRFGKQEYLDKAEKYYKKVYKIGPKLPHALYGLFELYRKSGQAGKMNETGQKILDLWPNDKQIKEALSQQI